jgi:hypothetical protein
MNQLHFTCRVTCHRHNCNVYVNITNSGDKNVFVHHSDLLYGSLHHEWTIANSIGDPVPCSWSSYNQPDTNLFEVVSTKTRVGHANINHYCNVQKCINNICILTFFGGSQYYDDTALTNPQIYSRDCQAQFIITDFSLDEVVVVGENIKIEL